MTVFFCMYVCMYVCMYLMHTVIFIIIICNGRTGNQCEAEHRGERMVLSIINSVPCSDVLLSNKVSIDRNTLIGSLFGYFVRSYI